MVKTINIEEFLNQELDLDERKDYLKNQLTLALRDHTRLHTLREYVSQQLEELTKELDSVTEVIHSLDKSYLELTKQYK